MKTSSIVEITPAALAQKGADVSVVVLGQALLAGRPDPTGTAIATSYAQGGLEALLPQLEGDFSLIINDGAQQKAHLITDRFATQPLYFHWDAAAATLQAATSLKGMAKLQRGSAALDWERLMFKQTAAEYPAPQGSFPTLLKCVYRLKGGCVGTYAVASNSWEIHPWADTPSDLSLPASGFTRQDFVDGYRQSIEMAVAKRVQGHKEVVVTLSGGFDSSIVFALAAQHTTVHAATICTATSIHNLEINRARELTQASGSQHLVFPVGFHDRPSYRDWIRLVLSKETAICGFEDFVKSQLMQRMQQTFGQTPLLLSGMGSDQFNGGTTSLDYADADENGSFNTFMHNMLRTNWERHREATFTPWFQFAYHLAKVEYRETLWPFTNDAWARYVRNNARSLQRRGVFLESKLASANGFGIGFPFLDEAPIALLNSIPQAMRPQLLYDKQVLRDAFKNLLPASFQGQPKFYRTPNAQAKLYSYLKPVAFADDYALLRMAYEAAPGLRERFSIDKLVALLDEAAASETFPAYDHLLQLINLGLLEAHLLHGEHFGVFAAQPPCTASNCSWQENALSARVLGEAG